MPIGGVKEKILAAKRNGIINIILPEKNKNDLIGIESATKGINIIFVRHANDVLSRVLIHNKPVVISKKKRTIQSAKAQG